MKSKVSIMQAVNKVLDYVGSEEVTDVPVLIEWATDADKAIGSYYDYISKIYVLDIQNCRAKLPPGTISLKGLLLGDHGCDCDILFDAAQVTVRDLSTGVENTSGFLAITLDTSNRIKNSPVSWEVQDNTVVLNGDYDGDKVTVKLDQYEYDKDENPLVNENNIRAIAAYLEYRIAKRSRWSKDKREKMDMVDIAELKQEWHNRCADARAESGRPTEAEQDEIAGLIADPISGRGIITPSDLP